ncbi:MAG TPA: hypothetical protein VGX76_23100 [Pirellulales bacterium]|nr:hypothetical protein [Pirellulales bacterium]
MPFVTIAERVGMEKGLLVGIEALVQVKFGEEGLNLLPEIRRIQDDEALLKILRSITTARSTDDVRRSFSRARRPSKTRRK